MEQFCSARGHRQETDKKLLPRTAARNPDSSAAHSFLVTQRALSIWAYLSLPYSVSPSNFPMTYYIFAAPLYFIALR